jgi:hypothetical protein
MIRYTLICDSGHGFDGWFADSASYDMQIGQGYVSCPVCASVHVAKAIMAPAVSTSRKRAAMQTDRPSLPKHDGRQHANPSEPAVAMLSEKEQALRTIIREVRSQIIANSTDVGDAFAQEARKIHEGESEERCIRGTASAQEIKALQDDGIETLPIPILPEDQH